jgi:hypothetical protein
MELKVSAGLWSTSTSYNRIHYMELKGPRNTPLIEIVSLSESITWSWKAHKGIVAGATILLNPLHGVESSTTFINVRVTLNRIHYMELKGGYCLAIAWFHRESITWSWKVT